MCITIKLYSQDNLEVRYIDPTNIEYRFIKGIISKYESHEKTEPYFTYYNLIDSSLLLSDYGIFEVSYARLPTERVFLFYRDKADKTLKFIENYELGYLLKFINDYIIRNEIAEEATVNIMYNFALFYDNYVFTKNKGGFIKKKKK